MNIFSRNKKINEKLLLVLIGLFIVLYCFAAVFRSINGDEAVIGEWAYWLATIGKVKSIISSGAQLGFENQLFFYHKLFVIVGAVVIKVLGLHLFILRMISLFASIIFLYILKIYYRSFSNNEPINYMWLFSLLILLANFQFVQYSFMYRPEVFLMTLGFASYICLDKYLRTNRILYIVIGGILAGLCVFTHLNGIIFIISGVALLILRKKFSAGIWFGLIGSIISLLFFYDINNTKELNQFIFQFKNYGDIKNENYGFFHLFIRIFKEPNRLLHSPKEIFLTLLFCASLLSNFNRIRKWNPNLLIYLLLLFIDLGAISHGKTPKYGLLYYPYLIIIIAYAFQNIEQTTLTWKRIILAILLVNLVFNACLIIKSLNFDYPNIEKRNALIASNLQNNNSLVFANCSFIFNEINKYQIHSSLPLRFSEQYRISLNKKDYFFNYLDSLNIRYIIKDELNDDFSPNVIEFKDLKQGEVYYDGFIVVTKSKDFAILEKQNYR